MISHEKEFKKKVENRILEEGWEQNIRRRLKREYKMKVKNRI